MKKGRKKKRSTTAAKDDDPSTNTIKFEVFCDKGNLEVRSNDELVPLLDSSEEKETAKDKTNGSSVEFQINPQSERKYQNDNDGTTSLVFDVFDASVADRSPQTRLRSARKKGRRIVTRRRTIDIVTPTEERTSSRSRGSCRRSLPSSRSIVITDETPSHSRKMLFTTFTVLFGVLGFSWLLVKLYAPIWNVIRRK